MEGDGIIKELKHYIVQVGQIRVDEAGRTELGYQLVNKATGVMEIERPVLPDMLVIAKRLDEGLEELLNGPKPDIAIVPAIPAPTNLRN